LRRNGWRNSGFRLGWVSGVVSAGLAMVGRILAPATRAQSAVSRGDPETWEASR
jgi:hypothetical protein